MSPFCYAWEFLVRSDAVERFEAAYGPEGDWVALFRRDPSYLGTELFRDRDNPLRFITIDRWVSYEACMTFRERHRSDFQALDRQCEALTERERHLGDFHLR